MLRESLSFYLVMGSVNCTLDPIQVLRDSLSEGVSLFQFREKGLGCLQGEEAEKRAIEMQAICREYNVPFIINDDIDLAIKINADGVHIGQEDGDPSVVKKLIGDRILGISAHSVPEALAAIDAGADYLGVGPMYATSTKLDTRPVSGPHLISEMRREGIQHPIAGIGGITAENVSNVIKAGADGVAVISCISRAPEPKAAAAKMKAEIHRARNFTSFRNHS
jgi:thiamine-phosphate pyrophosphorylase